MCVDHAREKLRINSCLSQLLLNSPDAASAPVNPFLLNARVMCSEERGAIYSETLVLWQELQVPCAVRISNNVFVDFVTSALPFMLMLLFCCFVFVQCIQHSL
jgi:hypothetical protein